MRTIWIAVMLSVPISCYAEQDSAVQCEHSLVADERFSSIKDKLSLRTDQENTPEMLADESLPDEDQQRAIAVWITEHSECQRLREPFQSQAYSAGFTALIQETEEKMIGHAADLYQRRISFGEFNRRRQALANEMRKQVPAMVRHGKSEK